MTHSIGYYTNQRLSGIQAIEEHFGSTLQGLSRFEKAQLLSILSLTVQEIEDRITSGDTTDFTPREAEQGAYPYEITENVDFCVVSLTEDPYAELKDYLSLSEALVAQLRHG